MDSDAESTRKWRLVTRLLVLPQELGTIIPRIAQWRVEHLCLEVLRILETDEVAFYDEGISDDQRDAQMAELGDAYTMIDNPYWNHDGDDDNVVYLR
jgi:hypothetical protein